MDLGGRDMAKEKTFIPLMRVWIGARTIPLPKSSYSKDSGVTG